jgi:N-acetylmuramoyl-L-alanine amidase
LVVALPADAARLTNWQFDVTRNELNFVTDDRVQPRAQLIPNPTRLVIDLPGVSWNRPTAEQFYGGAVRSVRVGQMNATTTRIVVELTAGYTMDPAQVRVRGVSPTQWTVALPTPTRGGGVPTTGLPTPDALERQRDRDWVPGALAEILDRQGQDTSRPESVTVDDVRLTSDGLVLVTSDGTPTVELARSRDRRQIVVDVQNARLASGQGRDRLLNRFGVARLILSQIEGYPPRVRLTMIVDPNSPDWAATVGSNGAIALQRSSTTAGNPTPPPSGSTPIPVPQPPPGNTRPLPRPILPPQQTDPNPTPLPQPSTRVRVVIDPGHGGRDPGAIGIGGLREVDVVLPISLEVASLLRQQGVDVVMPRQDDRFISLGGRTDLANRYNARAFVSIHANAISMSRQDVNGVETYYHVTGQPLAQSIHASIRRAFPYMRDRGVRQARFYVLRNTRMPSSLVEVGFVTGNQDNAYLRDPRWRSQMARAIAEGILNYLR